MEFNTIDKREPVQADWLARRIKNVLDNDKKYFKYRNECDRAPFQALLRSMLQFIKENNFENKLEKFNDTTAPQIQYTPQEVNAVCQHCQTNLATIYCYCPKCGRKINWNGTIN